MIPALDDLEKIEYYWYVGDPIPTVGLWKRTGRYEMPIFQNTRGQGVFNGLDTDDGDIDGTEPTDAFWSALEDVVDQDGGGVDIEGCEWFEREFIHALLGVAAETDEDDIPTEVGQLFAFVREGHHPTGGQATVDEFEEGGDD